jgi:hypothetical protein
MRIGLIAAFLIYMTSNVNLQDPAGGHHLTLVDEGFFETLEKMIPVSYRIPARDRFVLESASWDHDGRTLNVRVRTEHEKGTLLTMTGLPQSTMLDAFQISAGHAVAYDLPLATGQAIPCQVVVKSAFETELMAVANAPVACQNRLQVSGTLATGATHSMANGWVTVTVADAVFATIADGDGRYSLEVYRQHSDDPVTITAAGMVDGQKTVVPVFSGTIEALLDHEQQSASAWAAEILGRRHERRMLAALSPPGGSSPAPLATF